MLGPVSRRLLGFTVILAGRLGESSGHVGCALWEATGTPTKELKGSFKGSSSAADSQTPPGGSFSHAPKAAAWLGMQPFLSTSAATALINQALLENVHLDEHPRLLPVASGQKGGRILKQQSSRMPSPPVTGRAFEIKASHRMKTKLGWPCNATILDIWGSHSYGYIWISTGYTNLSEDFPFQTFEPNPERSWEGQGKQMPEKQAAGDQSTSPHSHPSHPWLQL